jgi:hypothetical protein
MQIDREELATVTGGKGAGGGEPPGGGGGGPGPAVIGGSSMRDVTAKQDQLAASLRALHEACEGLRHGVERGNEATSKALLGGLQRG